MEKNLRAVWAEIDLNKIENNMKRIKELAGDREVIAVVKADAYGHGATSVAPVLLKNGASKLAVAVIAEGIELRDAGIKEPIMILGYTPLELGEDLINYDIEQTVYDLEYAKELSNIAKRLGTKAKIHIALDTGMGRIGFLPNEESFKDVVEICNLDGLDVCGIFTHFSTADEEDKTYTYEQFNKMKEFNDKLKEVGINIKLKHASNSGAIIDLPETYLDGVRAGIILYGYYPSNDVNKDRLKLEPALTLKTRVSHVKTLDKDMYISYGRTFKTERKSVIATLPIGYADGYLRLLSGKAKVIINGKFANVVGRICMDQCMIDVTDIGDVKVSDEVILLGEDGDLKFNADDMAEAMGTINYEVLCMIRHRIPRIYIKDNEIVEVKNYL
ncbi:alanine racemase [Clostridium baratii]|uniref:alanine racemase n=1 Tax=Clostridium baratii TaxID=1561 RepID=UPI0030D2F522